MSMSSRERLLTALSNGKPDRLPCQVHSWMEYYLKKYLGGTDQYGAYERFPGMDWVIYAGPQFGYDEKDQANWAIQTEDGGRDHSGNHVWREIITTPKGVLTQAMASNEYTVFTTEYLIKNERDFELWEEYVPLPVAVDWQPIRDIKERIGDRGIVRSGFFGFGQGSPWQDFATLFGTEQSIIATFENPEWMHRVLESILRKRLRVIEMAGKIELDLVETGGGAGSNTVISPSLHREFCLPYDLRLHAAFHAAGPKVVYHLCGGVMKTLELVAQNGADGLETMTPSEMGGDCDFAEASRQVGDKLFFIGGFDQNAGFERGTPAAARAQVMKLHAARPKGGYICCPSDHFFEGPVENIQAFVDACRECAY